MLRGSLAVLLLCALGCTKPATPETLVARPSVVVSAAPPPPPRTVLVDTLPVPGDQPVFALRGGRQTGAVGVVFHGWCSHGMGFLQAFQWAAADVGRFIALQGDHHCGSGPMRGWSNDVVGLDRRIDAALRVYLGEEPSGPVVLIGSSQGAERAVDLARRFPQKYRWLVLASPPRAITGAGLGELGGGYFFIGQHEGRGVVQASRDALTRAGLRAELKVVPGGGHADFHGQGDPLMKAAFAFLLAPP